MERKEPTVAGRRARKGVIFLAALIILGVVLKQEVPVVYAESAQASSWQGPADSFSPPQGFELVRSGTDFSVELAEGQVIIVSRDNDPKWTDCNPPTIEQGHMFIVNGVDDVVPWTQTQCPKDPPDNEWRWRQFSFEGERISFSNGEDSGTGYLYFKPATEPEPEPTCTVENFVPHTKVNIVNDDKAAIQAWAEWDQGPDSIWIEWTFGGRTDEYRKGDSPIPPSPGWELDRKDDAYSVTVNFSVKENSEVCASASVEVEIPAKPEPPEPPPSTECNKADFLAAFANGGLDAFVDNLNGATCIAVRTVYNMNGFSNLQEGPQTLIGYVVKQIGPNESVTLTVLGYDPSLNCRVQDDIMIVSSLEEVAAVKPDPLTNENQGAQFNALILAVTRGEIDCEDEEEKESERKIKVPMMWLLTGPNVTRIEPGVGYAGAGCMLISESHPSVKRQNQACFPTNDPDWQATNAPCAGPVYDDGTEYGEWECDEMMKALGLGRLPVFGNDGVNLMRIYGQHLAVLADIEDGLFVEDC